MTWPTSAASWAEPGNADAVGTLLALPEGRNYDAKRLPGIWPLEGRAGALDCMMGYPTDPDWTIGLVVVANRHRRSGIGQS
jgi:hypothetical protein